MKSFFSKLVSFFNSAKSFFDKFFTEDLADGIMLVLEVSSPYVVKAYPIVKKIAELTPNRIDDEIVAAYERFGLAKLFNPEMAKEMALRELAKNVLRKDIPEGQTLPDYMLNTAIELAYAKFKQEMIESQQK